MSGKMLFSFLNKMQIHLFLPETFAFTEILQTKSVDEWGYEIALKVVYIVNDDPIGRRRNLRFPPSQLIGSWVC